jgi:hypothetical protein
MKKLRKAIFFGLLLVLIVLVGVAVYLLLAPKPETDHAVPYRNDQMPGPAGYSWKEYAPEKIKILIPDGWYWDEASDYGQYYVSKVSWEQETTFTTGILITVTHNIHFPDVLAQGNVDEEAIRPDTKKVISKSVERQGKATIRDVRILFEDPLFPENDSRRHKQVFRRYISRPDLQTLYQVRFESPVDQWDADWEKGKVLIDSFSVSD